MDNLTQDERYFSETYNSEENANLEMLCIAKLDIDAEEILDGYVSKMIGEYTSDICKRLKALEAIEALEKRIEWLKEDF